ncbi:hypothetical protein [Pseudomonas brassicacearum]|uniref:hypothetical protein n=1 Tax=Pseudomonas brassicacearum TaxID=930166 RepID=UPI0006408004|nr:hypothetical protein [Pseudomonas brassicacearum]
MFKKILFDWIKASLMGVGCSLLAAAFVSIVTPGTHPLVVSFCLVLGVVMMIADLVVSLVTAISNPKGE